MDFVTELPVDKSLAIIDRLSEACAQKGGQLSKQLFELVKIRDWKGLIGFNIDYSQPFSSDDFLYARQILALFQKRKDIDIGVDKEAVAYAAFLSAEDSCRQTNARFRANLLGEKSDIHSVLYGASRKISSILGEVPSLADLEFSFGPGATTSVKRARSHPRMKLEAPLTCSTGLLPILSEFLSEFPHLLSSHAKGSNVPVKLDIGKLTFVPKNAKTFRSIGIEPTLNGLGQQGIGKYIRQRLKRSGIDLRDQTRNQSLALAGSLNGLLATVDLSAASDTIAYGLVLHLLPPDWFEFLDYFRTGSVRYKDTVIQLEKFSSMGNSYTFELESLIFFALAFSTCAHLGLDLKNISVYGDDIIIPVEAMALFRDVLTVCGFTINLEKSFAAGPFRESCGADYLNGFDIRPFYLKDVIDVRTLFVAHNWFVRHAEPALAGIILEYIPAHVRLFGPDGYGDGHLIGSYRLRSSRHLKRCGYEGGFFDTYAAEPKRIRIRELTDWVYPLYCIYVSAGSETPMEHDIVPGIKRYKKVSIYTLRKGVFS